MKKSLLTQLQLEAGGSHYPSINPEMQARFAELIVRECMTNLYLNGYDDAVIQIQKHFGVEE